MSLILEALRKSEAERRRGEVPDLLSPSGPVADRARSPALRGWPWLVVGLAAVLALPVAWMMRGGPDADRTGAPRQASAGPGAEAGATPADASVEPSAATPVSTGARPPAAPPTVAVPPAPEQPPEAVVAPTTAPVPVPQPVSPGPLPGPPVATVPEPSPPPSPEPAPEPAPPPVAVAVPAPAPPSVARPDGEPPMSLARLPAGERGQLPPLKVSMHMWSEDVARRFAIIDGHRVGEGDRVGDAVVTAITRDGVVLDWRGRRIEVPIH